MFTFGGFYIGQETDWKRQQQLKPRFSLTTSFWRRNDLFHQHRLICALILQVICSEMIEYREQVTQLPAWWRNPPRPSTS